MTTQERTETCATCRFWEGRDYLDDPVAMMRWFKCRRHAPRPDGWPVSQSVDWCGEWQGDKGESE